MARKGVVVSPAADRVGGAFPFRTSFRAPDALRRSADNRTHLKDYYEATVTSHGATEVHTATTPYIDYRGCGEEARALRRKPACRSSSLSAAQWSICRNTAFPTSHPREALWHAPDIVTCRGQTPGWPHAWLIVGSKDSFPPSSVKESIARVARRQNYHRCARLRIAALFDPSRLKANCHLPGSRALSTR